MAIVLEKKTECVQDAKVSSSSSSETYLSSPLQKQTITDCSHSFTLEGTYTIEQSFVSPATFVLFIRFDENTRYCLKLWRICQNALYDTKDNYKNLCFLLDGLSFNKRFASNVYLGIVPVRSSEQEMQTTGIIELEELITNPSIENLDAKKNYALVMRDLDQSWQLDANLSSLLLGNKQGMLALGEQIASMQCRYEPATIAKDDNGVQTKLHMNRPSKNLTYFNCFPSSKKHQAMSWVRNIIQTKLHLNQQQFRKALQYLPAESQKKLADITSIMERAYSYNKKHSHFQNRFLQGQIKRCHGDLKATNLWVRPYNTGSNNYIDLQGSETLHTPLFELLALDCVDFRPDFYNIDTLSDVAMLVADIHAHLLHTLHTPEQAQELVNLFLQSYQKKILSMDRPTKQIFRDSSIKKALNPLLEYYIIEKAMICAYMWVLFDKKPLFIDGKPSLGIHYFDIAEIHARRLQRYIIEQEHNYHQPFFIPDATTLGEQASIGRHSG